jgi:hypothetical protein
LTSWIDSFIKQTENEHTPLIYRRWAAISLIGAALEQKVWIRTSQPVFPNLYILIVGHPGVGKTRIIRVVRSMATDLGEFHVAPISLTFAALVDCLDSAKRNWIVAGQAEPYSFNSLYICAGEFGAFMHKYDNEMIDGLAAFYDPDPYQQVRRTMERKPVIDSPQINMLAGVTPQNLLHFMPERAWGQGLTSRVIMIFSDERIVGDDFASIAPADFMELAQDLKSIHNLYGAFTVTQDYADCVRNWRELGEPPVPNHPKLTHYVTRRRVHLYKLSMISSVDRGNALTLTREDFNTAMGWLAEAESFMPEVFKAGTTNIDGQAMDEIQHFVLAADKGHGVSEHRIVHFARERVPIHSILRIVEIMEKSGQLYLAGTERRTGVKFYSVRPPAEEGSALQ